MAAPAAAPTLRPLSIGETLDVAIKIVFRNFWTLVRIVVFVAVPMQILSTLIDYSASEGAFTTGETERVPDDIGVFIAGLLVVFALNILGTLLMTAGTFKAIADAYLGERPSWADSLRFALSRIPSLLWLTLLATVVLLIAALPCFIPAIWLGVAWSVAMPALLTEDERGVGALRRSFRLVRGRWWPTFAILLLGFLLIFVASFIIALVFGFGLFFAESDLAVGIGTTIVNIISSVVTTPFIAAFITVVYFDLRVRKEGFDLQVLAERLGRPAPPASQQELPSAAQPEGAAPPPARPPQPPPAAE